MTPIHTTVLAITQTGTFATGQSGERLRDPLPLAPKHKHDLAREGFWRQRTAAVA